MKIKCVKNVSILKPGIRQLLIEDQSKTGQLFHLLKAHVLINNYL